MMAETFAEAADSAEQQHQPGESSSASTQQHMLDNNTKTWTQSRKRSVGQALTQSDDVIDLTINEATPEPPLRVTELAKDSDKRARSISEELASPISNDLAEWVSKTVPHRYHNLRATPSDNEMVQAHHADVTLTSRVGLDTMLEQMGKNHGFRADVVKRVYKHSNGLEATDEILHSMQEVAQARGEQELRCRSKRKKTVY